jgi:hypothetical protein
VHHIPFPLRRGVLQHPDPSRDRTPSGPTKEAVKTQIRLTLECYHSKADPEMTIKSALKVSDECGGPPAYLIKTGWLSGRMTMDMEHIIQLTNERIAEARDQAVRNLARANAMLNDKVESTLA